jgi:uncharacterized protein (DUF2236 family)
MVGRDSTIRLTGLIDIVFSFYASLQAFHPRHDSAVVAHRINAERLVLLGWSRAILLQMAHPLVAAGVADHSHFRAGPVTAVRRLHGTVKSMLALSFGDAFEAGHAIAAIRTIHTRVRGQLRQTTGPFPAGTRYSAEDPALLLWVHATLIDSVIVLYERIVSPLSPAERDSYCAEAADVAIALGVDEDAVPRSWPALQAYLQQEYSSGHIVVGDDARRIVEAVLFPPLSAVSGPFAWVNRLVTLGLLPDAVREQYRYAWNDRRARQLTRTLGVIRVVRRALPKAVAWWPAARK